MTCLIPECNSPKINKKYCGNHKSLYCRFKKCLNKIENYETISGKSPTQCLYHYELERKREERRGERNRDWVQERLNRKENDPDGLKRRDDRHNKFNRINKNSWLSCYNQKIKKYDRNFNLSKNYFYLLLQTKCFYCGKEPKCNYMNVDIENIETQDVYNFYSSVDRINNNKGYVYGNVIPSCNMIKKDYDYDIFLKHMEHITIFWKSEGRILRYPNITKNYKGKSTCYSKYKNKDDNIFTLTKEEFYYFRDKCKCYICNKETMKNHKNGIDRLNNNEGYYIGNSLTCCGTCNIMKKDRKLEDFIQLCENIYKYQKIQRLC